MSPNRPAAHSASTQLALRSLAAKAALVDYKLVPKRLTPGWEEVLTALHNGHLRGAGARSWCWRPSRKVRANRERGATTLKLNEAYRELEDVTPLWLTRSLRRLRRPELKPVRLVTGTALIAGSFFAFLPILGVEMFPLGLLLLAEDIPFLRKPAGHLILWFVRQWKRFRSWMKPAVARLMARWGK